MNDDKKRANERDRAPSSGRVAPLILLRKVLPSLRQYGLRVTWARARRRLRRNRKEKAISRQALFSDAELAAQRAARFPQAHTVSIIVPLYNTPESFLREMIESVLAQTYAGWELCLADGSDEQHDYVERACREYAGRDGRVRYRKLERNLGISGNTNAALEMATGDYVGLLDHDDLLHPAALYEVVRTVWDLGADFVYTDEATFLSPDRNRLWFVHFKPAYAPDTLLSNNYICHFSVFSRSLLDAAGPFDPACDGSQDHDMMLRLTEKAHKVAHIPEILYYWRAHAGSVAQDTEVKPYVSEAGVRAVEKSLRRRGLEGSVEPVRPDLTIYRIRYALKDRPKVSILIPNHEHLADLRTCLDSVFGKTTYPNFEIVIVENNSRSEELFSYYEEMQRRHGNLRVVTWEGAFNYPAINNFGAQHCGGEYLLLLNNDTEVITPDWIQEMLMFAQRPDVGAAGAKLYYPNGTIQHAGVVVGLGGVAGHVFHGSLRYEEGYVGNLLYAQDLSAVTGACMMIRRAVWEEMGGLDEALSVNYNDIDLCMRIRKAGYRIVWTPFAEMFHSESKSRGILNTPERQRRFKAEASFFRRRWRRELEAGDPYYNPNFTLEKSDYSIRSDIRPRAAR